MNWPCCRLLPGNNWQVPGRGLSSVFTTAVDGRNVPSTAVDHDRTYAKSRGRSQKSIIKHDVDGLSMSSMLDF